MIRNKNEVDSAVGYLRVQGAGCRVQPLISVNRCPRAHWAQFPCKYLLLPWVTASESPPGPAWRPSPNPRPLIKAAARRCAALRRAAATPGHHHSAISYYPLAPLPWAGLSSRLQSVQWLVLQRSWKRECILLAQNSKRGTLLLSFLSSQELTRL